MPSHVLNVIVNFNTMTAVAVYVKTDDIRSSMATSNAYYYYNVRNILTLLNKMRLQRMKLHVSC